MYEKFARVSRFDMKLLCLLNQPRLDSLAKSKQKAAVSCALAPENEKLEIKFISICNA